MICDDETRWRMVPFLQTSKMAKVIVLQAAICKARHHKRHGKKNLNLKRRHRYLAVKITTIHNNVSVQIYLFLQTKFNLQKITCR
jgi:hypothetical protein